MDTINQIYVDCLRKDLEEAVDRCKQSLMDIARIYGYINELHGEFSKYEPVEDHNPETAEKFKKTLQDLEVEWIYLKTQSKLKVSDLYCSYSSLLDDMADDFQLKPEWGYRR